MEISKKDSDSFLDKKLHLIVISMMVLTAIVAFNSLLLIISIGERKDIERKIDAIQTQAIEAKIDREFIKNKLFGDLSSIKASIFRQAQEEPK